jgi:membrane dipeptidase
MNRRDFLRKSAVSSLALAASPPFVHAADRPPETANETIERARQAALAILKPTAEQLAHGLDLHAASLVFESYGFSPRAAWDGDALRKAIEAGASPIELEDLREEMTMTRAATDPVERTEYLAAWKAAGVTCIFQNAGEETQDPMRLIKRLARFTYLTDRLRDFVARAVSPEDVVAAKKQGKHCLYFSGNGVPLAQRWENVEGELSYIRVFFQLGIRMMHMTYNRRNMIGDGCAEPANAGLSDFGRAAVAEMNRVGVIADVAHSGWQTSLETAHASSRPMVASHTACDGLHHHIRGKPDRVIKAIADTGGYVGICSVPAFLGGQGDIQAMLDHLDYAVRRFGAEHVTIGTDVAYTSRNMAAESKKVPRTGQGRPRWESFWPPGSLDFGGQPLSLAWTNWPLFTVGMVQRGFSDDDIRKVLGGNVMRVVRAALPAA